MKSFLIELDSTIDLIKLCWVVLKFEEVVLYLLVSNSHHNQMKDYYKISNSLSLDTPDIILWLSSSLSTNESSSLKNEIYGKIGV